MELFLDVDQLVSVVLWENVRVCVWVSSKKLQNLLFDFWWDCEFYWFIIQTLCLYFSALVCFDSCEIRLWTVSTFPISPCVWCFTDSVSSHICTDMKENSNLLWQLIRTGFSWSSSEQNFNCHLHWQFSCWPATKNKSNKMTNFNNQLNSQSYWNDTFYA